MQRPCDGDILDVFEEHQGGPVWLDLIEKGERSQGRERAGRSDHVLWATVGTLALA